MLKRELLFNIFVVQSVKTVAQESLLCYHTTYFGASIFFHIEFPAADRSLDGINVHDLQIIYLSCNYLENHFAVSFNQDNIFIHLRAFAANFCIILFKMIVEFRCEFMSFHILPHLIFPLSPRAQSL